MLLGIFITFILAPIVSFLALSKYIKSNNSFKIICISLGISPAIISWTITILLQLLPGLNDIFYIGIVLSILVATAFVYRHQFRDLYRLFKIIRNYFIYTFRDHRWTEIILSMGVILLILLGFYSCLTLPLYANDPLEYAIVSKLIYQAKTTSVYPFTTAEPVTGFYASSSHPLAYHSLIVWGYMLQGSPDNLNFMKLIAPFYASATALLIWCVVTQFNDIAGKLSALLLLLTPVYASHVAIAHIDSMRIFLFFVPFAFLLELIEFPHQNNKIILGLLVGMGMYGHSIGLLTLPFILIIYGFLSKEPIRLRILSILIIFSVAMSIGMWRYLQNLLEFGVPLRDSEPVLELPQIFYEQDLTYERNLNTPSMLVIIGIFRGLSQVNLFGLTNWLVIIFLLIDRYRIRQYTFLQICLSTIGLFLGLSSITVILGSSLVIKNFRYYLTIQPFICCIAGMSLFNLLNRLNSINTKSLIIERFKKINLFIIISLILFYSFSFYMRENSISLRYTDLNTIIKGDWFTFERKKLLGSKVLRYIREQTDTNSLFLIYRQAEFSYYAQRKAIRDIDTRLIDFYKINTKFNAYLYLKNLGINYIYLPAYQPSTFNNSMAYAIVADPKLSRIVIEDNGVRLFELLDKQNNNLLEVEPQPISIPTLSVVNDKSIFGQVINNNTDNTDFLVPGNTNGKPQQYVVTGQCYLSISYQNCLENNFEMTNGLYNFQSNVSGSGRAELHIVEHDKYGNTYIRKIWDSILHQDSREIAAQFRTSSRTSDFKIAWKFQEPGIHYVKSFKLYKIPEKPNFNSLSEQVVQDDSKLLWQKDFLVNGNLQPSFENKIYVPHHSLVQNTAQGIMIATQDKKVVNLDDLELNPEKDIFNIWISQKLINCQNYVDDSKKNKLYCLLKDKFPFLEEDEQYKLKINISGFGEVRTGVTWINSENQRRWKLIDKYYLKQSSGDIEDIFYLPSRVNAVTPFIQVSNLRGINYPYGQVYIKKAEIYRLRN